MSSVVVPEAGNNLGDRLERCYSGAVYDVLREMGYAETVLPSVLRPLRLESVVAGSVYPISGSYDASLDEHETLLQWTEFLSRVPQDTVVICQPNDKTISHMGELSAETLKFRGVKGYIVDGGCRDSEFIEKIGFPVFCRYFTPKDIVGRWRVDTMESPIEIGGVSISKDDYVIADRDGIVIIPGEKIEEVVNRTEEVLGTENKVRAAILGGEDPKDAYERFGKF